MTKSLIQQGEDAHEEYQKLVNIIDSGRKLDVLKGRQLWILKADNLYKKAVGEGVESWVDFLKMPEIAIPPNEATRLMEIYEYFVIKSDISLDEVAKAKIKSLHYLLPLVKARKIEPEEIKDRILDAQHLTQAQFRDKIYDVKTKNKGKRTYEFLIMRKCVETGTMQKVHGITSERIQEAFQLDPDSLPEAL